MDASSFDLRSLSNGSVGSLSSWAPLQRLSAGSTDALRGYFGPFATNASAPWDPSNYSAAALAQFAHTARLSGTSKCSASLRAVAAAAVDAANLNDASRAGAVDAAAAGPLAKKKRRTALAVWPPAGEQPAAGGDAEEAPERQPSPQGRLTPEALSQGAAAAEAALSSQVRVLLRFPEPEATGSCSQAAIHCVFCLCTLCSQPTGTSQKCQAQLQLQHQVMCLTGC